MTAANGPHKSINIKGLSDLDLAAANSSGKPWGSSRRRNRDDAQALVNELQPTWLVRSPPCNVFSSWQHVNYALMTAEDVEKKKLAGVVHLRFEAQVYREQVKRTSILPP